MRKLLVLMIPICFALLLTIVTEAQCGPTGGPCTPAPPMPTQPTSPANISSNTSAITNSESVTDADGDGVPDYADQCVTSGGPSWNNGCPVGEEPVALPTPTVFIQLPSIPTGEDASCQIATAGQAKVNIRSAPTTNDPVVGQMEPTLLYPVLMRLAFTTINGDEVWYQIAEGWVFANVVRIGGNCLSVMGINGSQPLVNPSALGTFETILPDPEDLFGAPDVDSLLTQYLQFCEDGFTPYTITPTTITQCDGEVFEFEEGFYLECYGELFDLMEIGDAIGELNCEWLESVQAGFVTNDGIVQAMMFQTGFTTIPYVDPESDSPCAEAIGLPDSMEIVGFNPVPPSQPNLVPVCMMVVNGAAFGLDGLVLVNPTGGNKALVTPTSNLAMSAEGIIVINGYGLDTLRAYLVEPAEDTRWTEVMFVDGSSLLVGTNGDKTYACPAGDNDSGMPIFDALVLLGFNPQPEPPAVVGEEATNDVSDPPFVGLGIYGFNPQPEPPAIVDEIGDAGSGIFSGIDIVGFNPQPEPPAVCFEI